MQIAYLHVVVNHFPIMAVPVLIGVLALGLWTRSAAVQRAALLGFVAVGLVTVAVYLTGQGAEDFAEHLPEVPDDDVIEAHETMATIAFALVSGLALLAAAVFARGGGLRWLFRREPDGMPTPPRGAGAVLVVALVAAAALGVTGRLGGKITHTEFHDGAAAHDDHEDDDHGDDDHHRGRGRGRG